MDLSVEMRGPDTAVVLPSGRLDLASAAVFKEKLDELVGEGKRLLVVDLGSTSFVDSSGLGAIIGALKTARLAGGDLRLVNPQEQARMILSQTTLDKVFRIYQTVEESLADS